MNPTIPLDNAVIGDTVAAVFRDPAYARTMQASSLWDLFLQWLGRQIDALFHSASQTPAIGQVLKWTVLIAIGLVLVRIGYALYLHYARQSFGDHRRGASSARREDPWLTAQRLAAAGSYTEAAHALYLALLVAVARHGHVTLDDSKTIGDYVRELRARSGAAGSTRFIDFTRSYETIVYGLGWCDAERFQRLRELATPLVGTPM